MFASARTTPSKLGERFDKFCEIMAPHCQTNQLWAYGIVADMIEREILKDRPKHGQQQQQQETENDVASFYTVLFLQYVHASLDTKSEHLFIN